MQTENKNCDIWYETGEPEDLSAKARALKDLSADRLKQLLLQSAMYRNVKPNFGPGQSADDIVSHTHAVSNGLLRSRHNLIASILDTNMNRLVSEPPNVRFVATLSQPGDVKSCKNLERHWAACKRENKFDTIMQDVSYDAAIWGTGAVKHIIDPKKKDRVKHERVAITELFVDPADAQSNYPTELYQIKSKRREWVARNCIRDKKQREEFLSKLRDVRSTDVKRSDVCDVVEAWKLPGVYAKGRHMIVCEDVLILDEEWKKDDFYFTFFHWKRPQSGFWGLSMVSDLAASQVFQNNIRNSVEKNISITHQAKLLVHKMAKVNEQECNDRAGGIIHWEGTPGLEPKYLTPSSIPGQLLDVARADMQDTYQSSGVSQAAAAGNKQPDIISGVAMRESREIQSVRFFIQEKRFVECYIEAAEKTINLLSELPPSTYIEVMGQHLDISVISLKDFKLDDLRYNIVPEAAGLLPQEPAGKAAALLELSQTGIFTKTQLLRQLGTGLDVDAEYNSVVHAQEAIQKCIDIMTRQDSPQQVPYDSMLDPNLAIELSQGAYAKEYRKDDPRAKVLGFLRTFKQQAQAALPPPPEAPQA
jgi:hypothetical protein